LRSVLPAPHEEAKGIEAGEDGLDRGSIQRALMLADLAEHVLDPMREVADHSAPDRVGGTLERVDRPEQRRALGLGRRLALAPGPGVSRLLARPAPPSPARDRPHGESR